MAASGAREDVQETELVEPVLAEKYHYTLPILTNALVMNMRTAATSSREAVTVCVISDARLRLANCEGRVAGYHKYAMEIWSVP
jgi:hypothetical protein